MNVGTAAWSDLAQIPLPVAPEIPRRWRSKESPRLKDILFWEKLEQEPNESAENDLAVAPGRAFTVDAMERKRTLGTLSNLIHQFTAAGFFWPGGEHSRVSPIAAESAKRLLALLSEDVPLPKVAPDDDGDVVFAWEVRGRTHLLMVDDRQLHFVENAGTQQAQYFDNLEFGGDLIPEVVRLALAGRS